MYVENKDFSIERKEHKYVTLRMLMKYREAYKQFESDTYEDDEKMRKRQRTHRGENQQLPRR